MKIGQIDFEAALATLPEGVNWGDHLTPEISLAITAAARPKPTPDPSLKPLGEGPRRELLIKIQVPENWESRLDMQWVVEREIHADRWDWDWPTPTPPAPAALPVQPGEKT